MVARRVTVDQRSGKKLIVVEGVPATVCTRCHQRYYDAAVVRKLERILGQRQSARRQLRVPVVRFDAVA
jgi:YgiT-type zinc finger domain-containing protein